MQYVYYETGDVSNITIKDVGDDWYRDLALFYTSDGKLWRVLWDKWKVSGGQITNYDTIKAREFYYDGPRQRYLSREVDPDTWEPTDDPQLWTDYHGQPPYGDFELTFDQGDPVTGETMRYLAGSGIQAQQTLAGGQPDETSYLHGDLIASTMLTTDEGGTAVSAVSYTAFGELITDNCELTTRYQYAGGWGYESGLLTLGGAPETLPITLQHIGWRWYDPSIGRFVQRDPIGIRGGLNVYAYVMNDPLTGVDPLGLEDWTFDPRRARDPWWNGGDSPRPRDGLINEPAYPLTPEQRRAGHRAISGIGVVWVIGGGIITLIPGGQTIGIVCMVAGTAMWGHEDIEAIGEVLLGPTAEPIELDPGLGPGGPELIELAPSHRQ